MLELWGMVEKAKANGAHAQYLRLVQRCAVTRKPVLSSLTMGFANWAPHDPMRLLLLGWVRRITALLIGGDGRRNGKGCSHIIGVEAWAAANESLQSGTPTIPSSWGKSPLALTKASSRKAEDWKTMGMHYGLALFNTKVAGAKVSQLWSMTSQMLRICFDVPPPRSDI